jgi:aromatic-L-amino-acid decarboxylase
MESVDQRPSVSEPADQGATAWAWDARQIRRTGADVADILAEYLGGLAGGPVHRPVPESLKRAWAEQEMPRRGAAPAEILARFTEQIAPYPFGNGHPRFYGWVNSPPAVLAVYAEALAAAMNPSVAGGDHAAYYLERQVVRWFAELAGMPPDAGGLLVSGASMATLTALGTARHQAMSRVGIDVRAAGLQAGGPRLLVYASAEVHGCVRKAVELLGIGSDNIRDIETDSEARIRPEQLAAMLAADRGRGYLPVAVIASAGTVNTGVIDPIAPIGAVCAEHEVWLHIDAAYGGPPLLLLPEYQASRDALGQADSVAIDPHKWLYVPVDAGLLLLREPERARHAFSLVPPYLRTDDTDGDTAWFSEYGFEQTRPFRALKIWMAMHQFGLDGYRDLIRHDLRLAEYLRTQVRSAPDLELIATGLSITCLRYRPAGWTGTPEQLDDLNHRLIGAVQQAGHAFLTGTTVRGQTVLRACIVNPGASEADIDVLMAEIHRHGAQLAGSLGGPA